MYISDIYRALSPQAICYDLRLIEKLSQTHTHTHTQTHTQTSHTHTNTPISHTHTHTHSFPIDSTSLNTLSIAL